MLAEMGHRPPAEVALLPVDDHVEGVADSGRRTAQRVLPEHGFPTSLARHGTRSCSTALALRDTYIVALLAIYTDSTLLRSVTSPRPWWSTENALWTRSSRLQAEAEVFGSIEYRSTVAVDDGSTGGTRVQAL